MAIGLVLLFATVLHIAGMPDPRAVLREHGWTPTMWLMEGRTEIGIGSGWDEALAASASVGLDFSSLWGEQAVEQVYDVGPVSATLLLVNERAVGAWLNLPAPHSRPVALDYPKDRLPTPVDAQTVR